MIRWNWFVLGTLIGVLFLFLRIYLSHATPDILLHIPDSEPLRSYFVEELGEPLSLRETKHDGIASYVVARDPFGVPPEELSNVFTSWEYRYRRILYPLLGGLGGVLSPRGTLYGLAILSALSLGLLLATVPQFVESRSLYPLAWTLIQPGILYSTIFLTPDTLSIALAFLGLLLWRKEKLLAAILFLALASLTKETALLFIAGLGLYEILTRKSIQKLCILFTSILPLIVWSIYVQNTVGNPFSFSGRISFTLSGLRNLPEILSIQSPNEAFLISLAIILTLFSLYSFVRTKDLYLRALMIPWLLTLLFSSEELLHYGNSTLRAFLPLFLFGGYAFLNSERES